RWDGRSSEVLEARDRRMRPDGGDARVARSRRRVHLARADDLAVGALQHEVRLSAARTPPPEALGKGRAVLHRGDALERARLARVALARENDLGVPGGLQIE